MEEKKDEEIIISEPESEHGGGNPYHKGKGTSDGGEFTEAPDGDKGTSEAKEGSKEESETKTPSVSDLLAAHREKFKPKQPSISEIIAQHRAQRENEANKPENIISLKNFPQTRERYVRATLRDRSSWLMSVDNFVRIKDHFDNIIRNASIGCNFWFDRDVLKFIESDQILNQFGATPYGSRGKGSGYTDYVDDRQHGRAKMSYNTFGTDGVWNRPDLTGRELYDNRCKMEKYGCLMDNDLFMATDSSNRTGTQYGDAFWILNDSNRDRVTFTIGDSLGAGYTNPSNARSSSGIPSFINDGLDRSMTDGFRSSSYVPEILRSTKISDLLHNLGESYFECQLHGEFKISRDVYACCAKPSHWDSPHGRKAIEALHKMGIKTFTRRSGSKYLEEIVGINPDGSLDFRRFEQ